MGDNARAPLKKQYIGFEDENVLGMINHSCTKTAIKMTTAQKHKYRMTGYYNNEWDLRTSITVYFMQLNRFQVSLKDCGIAMSNKKKVMTTGVQMGTSKMFIEEHMLAWENKPAIDLGKSTNVFYQEMA